jgi:membrane protein YqaA with SNARE-associated domain
LAERFFAYFQYVCIAPHGLLAWVAAPKRLPLWVIHLGGFGLIFLGLLDSSIIPVPGSMDILTVLLAARIQRFWWYYAFMATLGSVAGGYVTYRLARKQGKESLGKRLSKKRMQKVTKIFERWGFGAVVVPAILPPPMPMVPFILAAGAMQYSTKKFLSAFALGRGIRFTILAFLAARYGGSLLKEIYRFGVPLLIAFFVVSAGLGIWSLVHSKRQKKTRKAKA